MSKIVSKSNSASSKWGICIRILVKNIKECVLVIKLDKSVFFTIFSIFDRDFETPANEISEIGFHIRNSSLPEVHILNWRQTQYQPFQKIEKDRAQFVFKVFKIHLRRAAGRGYS